jgi:hypothetical protein
VKTCKICKETEEVAEFVGRRRRCKSCHAKIKAKYYQENKVKIAKQTSDYRKKNKEKITKYDLQRYQENKSRVIKRNCDYARIRKLSDPLFKLKNNLRALIYVVITKRKFIKNANTFEILGGTLEEIISHLGPKPEGNYHIDHICPCAQAQNEEELIKLQHYSNLRWLEANTNLSKSSKPTPEGEAKCLELLNREWRLVC